MTTIRHHSSEMQTARRMTAEQLRLLGVPLKASTSNVQMAELIAERMGWAAPDAVPAALLPFFMRFLDVSRVGVTPPPYRPVVRRPMCYDLAMRNVAARAAAVQPHLTHAASNVITWRELAA
ncbi:hypothetical protein LMG26858_02302 [Achromobacter anxifer]|uniref:Uncharacterized protein n=1 Tax=Achromobacter anxifer TaxID=1287737 RepID=A0A6S7CS14_9BURK|nr:hypothetical protein [Achromobacter anxifer]CAB3862651.1 hypothetical protein LMG26858_02302 [Achromobacter anxifer]